MVDLGYSQRQLAEAFGVLAKMTQRDLAKVRKSK